MEAVQYQGLFYLSAGVGTFASLLFGLRSLRTNKEPVAQGAAKDHDWHHKELLEIVEIISEAQGIKTFRFKRQGNKLFPKSLPGQFLSFQIGENEKNLRSYSISASTLNPHLLQVSIKKLNNGLGSGWFHERKVGDRVWAFPPNGHFSDATLGKQQRIYVAGGIGITPILSMLLTNLDSGNTSPMTLFYGMRNVAEGAFHSLLVFLASRHSHFNYYPIFSAPDDSSNGDKGHLTFEFMKSKHQPSNDAHYFFCGPPVMTEKIVSRLLSDGIPAAQLHDEKFASPTAFDPEKIPHREANIKFNGKSYKYSGKQTLLEFLETQGITLPFACRVGVCGTCKCLTQGKTSALTDAGLTLVERRQPYVLSCVGYPEGDIELRVE